MKLAEKKEIVLEYLREARGRDKYHPLWDGFRSPTEIGTDALDADWSMSYSKAIPICKALVAEGLLERSSKGCYRIKENENGKNKTS